MAHKDSTPELTITNNIRKALEGIEKLDGIDIKVKGRCKQLLDQSESNSISNEVIPVNLLRDVYKTLKNNGKTIYLHELVEGAVLVTRPVVLPPRNPELEARVQGLKIIEANKEYRRMTQNVDPMQKNQKFTFQSEVKSMNRQLTHVLNFLITVAAGFAFGYKIVEYTFGKVFPMQMLAGLVVGTVIFFVDLYFMLKYAPV